MTQLTDIAYLRMALNVLSVIHYSGITTRNQLATALDMSPVAVAGILEELEEQQFITYYGGQVRITKAGVKEVGFISLVRNGGKDNVYRRWTPTYSNGRKRAA